MKNERTMD